jgi:hypothetical protein
MLTSRYAFSAVLTSSAVRQSVASRSPLTNVEYSATIASATSGDEPPQTRLMVRMLRSSLPGITRSGQWPRCTRGSSGRTTPSMVPGAIVDSTITSAPPLSTPASDVHADLNEAKRARWSASTGVSTQMITTSALASCA